MTQDRRRRIEALYRSALEHGIGVLEGVEPEVRAEVERLLSQAASGVGASRKG